jgi:hypothetical protein
MWQRWKMSSERKDRVALVVICGLILWIQLTQFPGLEHWLILAFFGTAAWMLAKQVVRFVAWLKNEELGR